MQVQTNKFICSTHYLLWDFAKVTHFFSKYLKNETDGKGLHGAIHLCTYNITYHTVLSKKGYCSACVQIQFYSQCNPY